VILVDTHVVLWLAFDQGLISSKAKAAIGSFTLLAYCCDNSSLE
jgi:PIN domain nuclease of toxin-antitoxin system